MSDTRKIVIEIRNAEETEDTPKNDNAAEEQSDKLKKQESSGGAAKVARAVLLREAKHALQLVGQAVESSASRYLSMSEDYIAENTYGNAYTAIKKSAGFASSIMSGAMAGNLIAPGAGTVVGAAVGAAGWGISNFIQGINTKSAYYSSLNAARIETNFSQVRAGLVNGSKGIEN